VIQFYWPYKSSISSPSTTLRLRRRV